MILGEENILCEVRSEVLNFKVTSKFKGLT
jgi:hypothetical protein